MGADACGVCFEPRRFFWIGGFSYFGPAFVVGLLCFGPDMIWRLSVFRMDGVIFYSACGRIFSCNLSV